MRSQMGGTCGMHGKEKTIMTALREEEKVK